MTSPLLSAEDFSALSPVDRLAKREARAKDFHRAFFMELYTIWQEQDWRMVSEDFSVYIESAFGYGRRYADYLHDALRQRANMESLIANGFDTMPIPIAEDANEAQSGTRVPTLPDPKPGERIVLPADLPGNEGVLRALRETLAEEDDQIRAWILAMDKAAAAGNTVPTVTMTKAAAIEVKAAVEVVADERAVNRSKYASVALWMRTGRLTPASARALIDALDSITPALRENMLRHQVVSPAVIRRLAESAASETYQEVMATGFLQFADGRSVPLAQAMVKDVQDLFAERAKERRLQGHALTQNQFIFTGQLVERDLDGETVTLKVSRSALEALPMGVALELDARWTIVGEQERRAA